MIDPHAPDGTSPLVGEVFTQGCMLRCGHTLGVIPAKAGTSVWPRAPKTEIPAYAGMTPWEGIAPWETGPK